MTAAQSAPLCLDFEGNLVRFVGTQDKLEWVAIDVCNVLGIANYRDALSTFTSDEKGISTFPR